MQEIDQKSWKEFTTGRNIHLLQTAEWGNLKEAFGWRVKRVTSGNFCAQILFKPLPLGFSVAYIPKLDHVSAGLLSEPAIRSGLDDLCAENKAAFLKVEPDVWRGSANDNFVPDGFLTSKRSIQPPNTILVDLNGDEDQILARMKQKFRYNIKLAAKKDIKVEESTDVTSFYRLMVETGRRDGFHSHSLEYYQKAFNLFHPPGYSALMMANYLGEPVAGVMIFAIGKTAWYLYGASSNAQRNRMPAYLAQWKAMLWAKSKGCEVYDLWGIPDASEAELEANFEKRSDDLWGVYRFKRGFGGKITRSVDSINRVYSPLLYKIYTLRQKLRGIQD